MLESYGGADVSADLWSATQLQTNHTNTLASRKPSWRLRAGVSSATHLLSFTELISIKTGWSEQMEDVIEFP